MIDVVIGVISFLVGGTLGYIFRATLGQELQDLQEEVKKLRDKL